IHLGLGSISRLLNRLDNPQEKYGTILIGGTNGKGSTAAMVASVLRESGFKVGLYTSPHLSDVRERITVDGSMISCEAMERCIRNVEEERTEDITYFEFLTAVAFIYFYHLKVDIAVLEVGMGGRLDATNVVDPIVSVVSNVSLEHRAFLGGSLKAIAFEKGGIIKDKGVLVTAAKQKPVIKVFEDICLKKEAKMLRLGQELRVKIKRGGTFSFRGIGREYRDMVCSLKGRHQSENAALAIAAIEIVREKGYNIDDDAVFRGIQNAQWEGRLEILQKEPMVLVDGAHNPAGISVLCRALRSDFKYRRLILIFGVLCDKDWVNMLRKIVPLTDHLIITKPQIERAMSPEKVEAIACRYMHHNVECIENSINALYHAFSLADVHDLICVTGSLFLVGEIKKIFCASADGRTKRSVS
ncbi:dihydrofolate synthase, partial [Alternaria alternata]